MPQAEIDTDGVAVFLIDMQEIFVCKLPNARVQTVVAEQRAVIARCRELGIPVFHIEFDPLEYGDTDPSLKFSLKEHGNVTYVIKTHANAFSETQLEKHLVRLGIIRVFAMGIKACVCVRETVAYARAIGIDVAVAEGTTVCSRSCSGERMMSWYGTRSLAVRDFEEFLRRRMMTVPIQVRSLALAGTT